MKIRQFYSNHRHFILYFIFGCISTGVEFGIYALLCRWIPYLWANIIGFHVGIVCSFLLNRSLNFKKEDKVILRFTSFYLIQLFCLAINSMLLYLFVDLAELNHLIAKGLTIILTAFLLFILNKKITFGKRI